MKVLLLNVKKLFKDLYRKTHVETWRSDDHSYTSYADSATTISNTAMEPSLTDETVDEVGTVDMAPPIVDTIT